MRIKFKVNEIIQCVALFFLCVYIFFPSILIKDICAYITAFLLIVTFLVKSSYVLRVSNITKIWIFIIFYSVLVSIISLGIDWSNDGISAVKWMLFAILLYQMILFGDFISVYVIRMLLIFSTCFCFMTYLQFVDIGVVDVINMHLLGAEELQMNSQAKLIGSYYGITSSNFLNAFYISILNAYVSSRIVNSVKYSISDILFYIIGVVAILLTGKKGIIIANFFAFIVVFFVLHKINIKVVAKLIFIVCIFYIVLNIIMNFEMGAFEGLIWAVFDSKDISNGRFDMYAIAFNNIRDSLLLGNGWGSSYKIFSNGVHNIYIQLVYEIGFIGMMFFVLFFVYNLIDNRNAYLRSMSMKGKRALSFCLYMQIVFLVYGFTGNPLFYYSTLLIYFIVLSVKKLNCVNVKL